MNGTSQDVPNAPPARTVMSVQIEAGFEVMLDVIAAAETRQPAAMMYPRQVIEPGGWRRPGLPLSPAIRAGEFVFLTGCIYLRSIRRHAAWTARSDGTAGAGQDGRDPSEYYFRVAPMFETGAERYAWLNKIMAVGVGERLPPNKVRYEIFEIL